MGPTAFIFFFLSTGALGAVIPTECPQLPAPPNGRVCYSIMVGSNATFTCDVGYTLIGSDSSLCQPNFTWSNNPPTCQPIDCGPLVIPDNGNSFLTTTTLGSIASFSCRLGYNLIGADEVFCQENGGWSAEEPVCQIVDCGPLVKPGNGNLIVTTTTLGSSAWFSCRTGYNLVGNSELVCQANGGWSSEEPFCLIVECDDLTDIPNGTVIMPSSNTYNLTATYECNIGYIMSSGDQMRVCEEDGNWSGQEPICSSVLYHNCLVGADICDGLVNSECNGTVCVCTSGFYDPGNATCISVDCGPLVTPDNGFTFVTTTTLGSIASFACSLGYNLVGAYEIFCQDNGGWSAEEPFCQIVDCGPLVKPGNGDLIVTTTTLGSSAWFSCRTGYNLVGDPELVCQSNSGWSSEEPFCLIVECDDLTDIPNGTVIMPSSNTYNLTATYECNIGYIMSSGDQMRVCEEDGNWSGQEPTCSSVLYHNCLVGADICDGLVNSECNGTVCVCTSGFYDPGNATCISVDCGPLVTPDNGYMLVTTTTLDSAASFSCRLGYNLVGSYAIFCQENGGWSAEEPFCLIVECDDLTDIPHGTVMMPSSNTYNLTATYECNIGYIMSSGDQMRVCEEDGNWSGQEPTCSSVLYHNCQVGADICDGLVNSECNGTVCVCTSGFYDPGNATCVSVDCGVLPAPVNGHVSISSGTGYRSQALYICIDGYVLYGPTTRECQADGTYELETPVCNIIDCGYPSQPLNGMVYTIGGTTFEQKAHYICDTGYILSTGYQTRVCQSDQSWSGPDPVCSEF